MEKPATRLVYRRVKDDCKMCLDGLLPAKRSRAWSAVGRSTGLATKEAKVKIVHSISMHRHCLNLNFHQNVVYVLLCCTLPHYIFSLIFANFIFCGVNIFGYKTHPEFRSDFNQTGTFSSKKRCALSPTKYGVLTKHWLTQVLISDFKDTCLF